MGKKLSFLKCYPISGIYSDLNKLLQFNLNLLDASNSPFCLECIIIAILLFHLVFVKPLSFEKKVL